MSRIVSDIIRNECIRGSLGTREMKEIKMKWSGHVLRKEIINKEDRWTIRVEGGKLGKDMPKKKQMEVIRVDLRTCWVDENIVRVSGLGFLSHALMYIFDLLSMNAYWFSFLLFYLRISYLIFKISLLVIILL